MPQSTNANVSLFAPFMLLVILLAVGGCEYFEPPGPPGVAPRAEFTALTDRDLGAAGGYVVGIAPERLASGQRGREQAVLASLAGETTPATQPVLPADSSARGDPSQAGDAIDFNEDGFITLDEIIVLARAQPAVPGSEIARRLTRSGYVLGATDPQLRHLRAMGVPEEALAPLRAGSR